MKWIGKIILIYVVLNSCESANEKIKFNSNYSIIPKPQQLSITEGFFEISEKTCFYYDSSEIKVVEFLTNYLAYLIFHKILRIQPLKDTMNENWVLNRLDQQQNQLKTIFFLYLACKKLICVKIEK